MADGETDSTGGAFHIEGGIPVFNNQLDQIQREQEEARQRDKNYRAEQLRLNRRMMFFTGLLALVGFFGFVISAYQSYIAKLNADAAKDNAIAAQSMALEMKSNSADTHELAVQAKNQADRTKDVADRALSQANATNELARQARRSADAAKESAEAALVDQRPYVVVKLPGVITPKFAPNSPMYSDVTITNIGRTPAMSMGSVIDLVYFPPPTPKPGEYVMRSQKSFIDTEFGGLASIERQGRALITMLGGENDLAPGADYLSSNSAPGLTLTQTQFDDIRSDNPYGGALFFVGLITYTDSASHPYSTEFCWYLTGGDVNTWHRCRFHHIIR